MTVSIKALPDDIRINTADGDVWANKAFLSVSSDYFNARLDEKKFKKKMRQMKNIRLVERKKNNLFQDDTIIVSTVNNQQQRTVKYWPCRLHPMCY